MPLALAPARLAATAAAALVLAAVAPARAQDLDVPFSIEGGDGQAATCASSVVAGLDPAGDGFLAVRSGPGTEYREIDRLPNGVTVFTCDGRGDWVAIVYGDRLDMGWVHGRWLRPLAG